ncbi:MAG: hypothetical protein HGB10_04575 [Coriobacteriia bacterium]|nr:hypothetical protein [Coriobacteriia bacterium]
MSKQSRFVRCLALTATALIIALAMTGCGVDGPTWADKGAVYDNDSALEVQSGVDTSALAEKPTADSAKLRHQALAALRRQGESASAAADLLTKTFPSDINGVPVYVERCTFSGAPAVLVVEATGPKDGKLSSTRLWVVSDTGEILFAGSR